MSNGLNIKQEDCRFIINEDKKIVICIIENTKDLFCKFNYTIQTFVYTNLLWKYHDKLLLPNHFRGIAVCSDDDEWDVEKGKLLAFSRAKDKLNKSFFKRVNLFFNSIDNILNNQVDIFNRLGDKLAANTEYRLAKLDEILGDREDGMSED